MMGYIVIGFLLSIIVAGSLAAFIAGGNGLMLALFVAGVLGLVKTGSDVIRWSAP